MPITAPAPPPDEGGGSQVTDRPRTPEDYATTIYEKLGIDRERPPYMASHRPVYFGHLGAPIAELL